MGSKQIKTEIKKPPNIMLNGVNTLPLLYFPKETPIEKAAAANKAKIDNEKPRIQPMLSSLPSIVIPIVFSDVNLSGYPPSRQKKAAHFQPHANEECYVFQDETGKWRYGHIAVTRDGDKITAFNGDKTWREIDIGDYRIYELYVPTGFKKWNYAEFEISANKETGTGTFAALQNGAFTGKFDATTDIKKDTSATSSSGFGSIEQQKNVTVAEGERVGKLHFTYVYDEENQKYTGVLTEDLYNEYLDQLPATGGMGTVLFTAGGIAVILMAGALFVVYMKKRNAEEEE